MAKLHLAHEIFDLIYPIGSIYMSVNDTPPDQLFGGTWERISGYFLLGVDPSTSMAHNKAGNKGGSWDTDQHVLTEAQIPSHSHRVPGPFNDKEAPAVRDYVPYGGWSTSSFYVWTSTAGGNQGHSHKHTPPYFAVNMWRRTA